MRILITIALILLGFVWGSVHFAANLMRGDWWALVPAIGLGLCAYYFLRALIFVVGFLVKHHEALDDVITSTSNIAWFLTELIRRNDPRLEKLYKVLTLPKEEFIARMRGL